MKLPTHVEHALNPGNVAKKQLQKSLGLCGFEKVTRLRYHKTFSGPSGVFKAEVSFTQHREQGSTGLDIKVTHGTTTVNYVHWNRDSDAYPHVQLVTLYINALLAGLKASQRMIAMSIPQEPDK